MGLFRLAPGNLASLINTEVFSFFSKYVTEIRRSQKYGQNSDSDPYAFHMGMTFYLQKLWGLGMGSG